MCVNGGVKRAFEKPVQLTSKFGRIGIGELVNFQYSVLKKFETYILVISLWGIEFPPKTEP